MYAKYYLPIISSKYIYIYKTHHTHLKRCSEIYINYKKPFINITNHAQFTFDSINLLFIIFSISKIQTKGPDLNKIPMNLSSKNDNSATLQKYIDRT